MKRFELINERYSSAIKKIYEEYFYVELDYELYKKFVVRAYEKAKEYCDDINYIDKYFFEYLNVAVQEYIKIMFKEPISAFNIVSNFIESKIKNVSSYKNAIQELKKFSFFLSSFYDDYTSLHFQEFLKNPKLSKLVKIVVDKNLNVIKEGNLETIFDDVILTNLLQVYCLENGIDFDFLDDAENIEDEEIRYLLLKASNGDKKAEREIIDRNAGLIKSIANKYIPYCRSLKFMDLVQEGNIGLFMAMKSFDFNRACKFSTYATWLIRQNITRAMANTDKMIRIPVHLEEKLHKYRRSVAKLQDKIGRKASEVEIAEYLKIPVQKVREYESVVDAISLNAPVGEDEDVELGAYIIDVTTANFEDELVNKSIIDAFVKSLDSIEKLSERDKDILCSRIGIYGPSKTLPELSKKYGISTQAISAASIKAMKKFFRSEISQSFAVYADNPDKALQLIMNYQVKR